MKSAAAPKSALGRALYYLREQWPYLIRFLGDGRLEISNNGVERSVKPFVMGRKNWLFANTEGGAQSSAMIYSLIETAKENGLAPYRYFIHVLTEAPGAGSQGGCWAENLLPEYVKEGCCGILKNKLRICMEQACNVCGLFLLFARSEARSVEYFPTFCII